MKIMNMDIKSRILTLISRGVQLHSKIRRDDDHPAYWMRTEDTAEIQAWLSSAANLIIALAPSTSPLSQQTAEVLGHPDLKNGIPSHLVMKMQGLLLSAIEE